MPRAVSYLLASLRPDAVRLDMTFRDGKKSLGGEEKTPTPLTEVKRHKV